METSWTSKTVVDLSAALAPLQPAHLAFPAIHSCMSTRCSDPGTAVLLEGCRPSDMPLPVCRGLLLNPTLHHQPNGLSALCTQRLPTKSFAFDIKTSAYLCPPSPCWNPPKPSEPTSCCRTICLDKADQVRLILPLEHKFRRRTPDPYSLPTGGSVAHFKLAFATFGRRSEA